MEVVKSFSAVIILIPEKTSSIRLDAGGFRRVGRGRELPSLTAVRRDRVVRRREDVSGSGVLSDTIDSGFDCGSSTSCRRLGGSSTMGEPVLRGGDD